MHGQYKRKKQTEGRRLMRIKGGTIGESEGSKPKEDRYQQGVAEPHLEEIMEHMKHEK
jgi:hypothetical protein